MKNLILAFTFVLLTACATAAPQPDLAAQAPPAQAPPADTTPETRPDPDAAATTWPDAPAHNNFKNSFSFFPTHSCSGVCFNAGAKTWCWEDNLAGSAWGACRPQDPGNPNGAGGLVNILQALAGDVETAQSTGETAQTTAETAQSTADAATAALPPNPLPLAMGGTGISATSAADVRQALGVAEWRRVKGVQLTPPPAPGVGDTYIVQPGSTDPAWAGWDDFLATWDGTAWTFLAPSARGPAWLDNRLIGVVSGDGIGPEIALASAWEYLDVNAVTPAAPLHLERSGGFQELIRLETGTGGSYIHFEDPGSANGGPGVGDVGDWQLGVWDSDELFITVPGSGSAEFLLRPNGNATFRGTVTAGGVLLSSDRALKRDLEPAPPVLESLRELDVQRWRFAHEPPATRHLGPTAQDFAAAFGLGEDDGRHINVTDAIGVTLAAVQEIAAQVEAAIEELEQRLEMLEETRP